MIRCPTGDLTDQSIHNFPNNIEISTGSVNLDGSALSLEQIRTVAVGEAKVVLTDSAEVRDRMELSQGMVDQAIVEGQKVYGINTGYGGMADLPVSAQDAEKSQENLLNFLSTSTGDPMDKCHVRASMLMRANMLLRGASGVRMEIVERLIAFLNADFVPVVGKLGSIGASGDLVPLAVLARAITGQGNSCQVQIGDQLVDRDEALKRLKLKPLKLKPKEGLAIVNGTTFSTAIAANNIVAARDLVGLTLATHALMARALIAHGSPFADFVHKCKPHPGQLWVAETMRHLLGLSEQGENDAASGKHLQDRYSIRCLPQYLGPSVEAILNAQKTVEIESEAITDNPLIDTQCGDFYQSGNFLGQYIGIAMDDLRKHLALFAKHLDVQIALLVSPEFSHGLPASLTENAKAPLEMNLKGLQITANSIAPELTHLGLGMVDHFPTHAEQFNQNINGLSWGAAIKASESINLYIEYSAIALIFAVQALDLRASVSGEDFNGRKLLNSDCLKDLYDTVYKAADLSQNPDHPLVRGEAPISIEQTLKALKKSIAERGAVANAVRDLSSSLPSL